MLQQLNERFGTDFSDEDKLVIENLEQKLAGDDALKQSLNVNPPEAARLAFEHKVNDHLQDLVDVNFKLYKRVTDDREFGKMFLDLLFERFVAERNRSAA